MNYEERENHGISEKWQRKRNERLFWYLTLNSVMFFAPVRGGTGFDSRFELIIFP